MAEPVQVEAEDAPPASAGSEKVEEVEQLSEKESKTVEAPVSEPEAATPRPANGGEAVSHDVPPEPGSIDINTPEGVERFFEVLDSYRVSDSDSFKKFAPYLKRAIYATDDPNGNWSKVEKGLERYARAVNHVRTGSLERTQEKDRENSRRLTDVGVEIAMADAAANRYYERQGLEVPGYGAFRAIANYGEFGNEINDVIVQDTLLRRTQDKNTTDRIAAYEAISPSIVYADNVSGEADWHREIGMTGIPYNAPTEMGYDPDIEMNKLRRHLFVNKYSDMLAKDRNLKKRANATMNGLTVQEIEEKSKPPYNSTDSGKAIYSGDYARSHDKDLADAYYTQAATRTAEKLKPGSYVMLNNYDAEVYQIGEDGALLTPEGDVWGRVDFEKGTIHDSGGVNIYDTQGGARLYADADELMRYAALDDQPNGLDTSADPGYRSRYEDDPKLSKKFERAIKHLKQEEKALTFKARMQEEYGRAVAKHSTEDLYTIATSKFGMPPFSKEIAEDNSPNGILRREIETKRYLKSQFNAGKARYDFGKQALVKSNRKPIEDLMPKKSLNDVLGDDLPVATKASIMNAARRKRNRVTTQGDQFAGAFEGKIGVHNPSAHRRENWSTERVAPEQAKTGSLLYNPDAKYDDKYEVFVVVDREKGLMAPIKEATWQHRTQAEKELFEKQRRDREIAKVKELSRKDMALASEYSIQDALNRHKMKDPSLKVEVMPLQLKNQRGLALW